MSLETKISYPIKSLLNNWYIHMRSQDLGQAREAKEKVEKKIKDIEDKSLLTYHSLFEVRYQILEDKFDEAEELLNKLEAVKEEFDGQASYYFNFFRGMCAYGLKDYNEALDYYGFAVENLEAVSDEIEVAEFHYKIAAVYYFIDRTSLSVSHGRQALEIFRCQENTLKRQADCEMLLGINCVEMHQYEDAEVQLHSALDYAGKAEDQYLKSRIYHNIGMLYAEQNLSSTAITWLEKALMLDNDPHETVYLTTKEYFKLGKTDEARALLNKGIKLSQDLKDQRYVFHFKLLEALYSDKKDNFENVYKEGISYFKGEELWTNTQEYAEQLARFYRKHEKYKAASDYYQLGINARENIKKLEALK